MAKKCAMHLWRPHDKAVTYKTISPNKQRATDAPQAERERQKRSNALKKLQGTYS
jgi:hypothetical protein